MWANTAIPGFAEVAVHAENLEPVRVVILLKPLVYLPSVNLPAMLGTVVIDMIQRKKRLNSFPATGAYITAIRSVSRILQLAIAKPLGFLRLLWIPLAPLCGTLRRNSGILCFPTLLRCSHFVSVVALPFSGILRNPLLVSLFPCFAKDRTTSLTGLHISAPRTAETETTFGLLLPTFAALHQTPAWLLIVWFSYYTRCPSNSRDF
jgi:hypothetical protein